MELRELHPEELDQLIFLFRHLHDEDDPLPPLDVVQSIWKEIQENQNHKYFGLFEEDTLISSCVLNIIPNLTRGCRPYGVIENVVTHSDYRRKGFGKSLLQYALNYAWNRNCYKVMLLTGRKDEGVYRFYESTGFDRNAKQAFLAKPVSD